MNKKKRKWRISTHLYENMVGQFMVCFTQFFFYYIYFLEVHKDVHAFDLFMCEIDNAFKLYFIILDSLTRNWFFVKIKSIKPNVRCD